MRKPAMYAAVAVIVIALSGCAANVDSASVGNDSDVGSDASGEATYLTRVKHVWFGSVPSDDDLIAYGKAACESLEAGTAIPDVVVLPDASGEVVTIKSSDVDKNNWHVVRFGPAMCP